MNKNIEPKLLALTGSILIWEYMAMRYNLKTKPSLFINKSLNAIDEITLVLLDILKYNCKGIIKIDILDPKMHYNFDKPIVEYIKKGLLFSWLHLKIRKICD